jgi:hypothetical protein
MPSSTNPIFIGDTPLQPAREAIQGDYVTFLGELFYKIENYDGMAPFFMTIVSSSDHWLFISSNGAITAGRGNSDQALFPYYTEDKITDSREYTGSKTIMLVNRNDRTSLWEPFSGRQEGQYAITRSLYKNISGTVLVFEEHNLDLHVIFRYAWRTSDRFGLIKSNWMINNTDTSCQVELLDGLQNILPANITEQSQNTFSNLLDAYKRSEVDPQTGLAIYFLNSRMTDKAEPSESLLASIVAQVGLPRADYLVSSQQLECFRLGNGTRPEADMRGKRGAYFAHSTVDLGANQELTWHLMADVYQDSAAIVRLRQWLKGDQASLVRDLESDIGLGQENLWKMVASADGLQLTNDRLATANHFANVMFNLMRGGIFADQYRISRSDFMEFTSAHNKNILEEHAAFFNSLSARMHISELQARAEKTGIADLVRLTESFLPLIFSRRHGDPSRPWNRFSINLKNPDGSMKLDYEGNWRDIFQNWEALACSYPEFIESMICTFLNATTPDGYNPYRITLHGIEWEVPDPGNPWSNIGYWSDHQIIYLQKLLELSVRLHPVRLQQLLTRPVFSYANVPYRIKQYEALLQDPGNTIEFDWQLHQDIEEKVLRYGTDARLLFSSDGTILHTCLVEKLLTMYLAKLSNLVPEGGIWMNTQRPEWNDANNALVGKGLSVVTLCYLRRSLAFCLDLLRQIPIESVPIHAEVFAFYTQILEILQHFKDSINDRFDDMQRRKMMDALGQAGSAYRWGFYRDGFSGRMADLVVKDLVAFFELSLQYVEHSLRANRRTDGMYHAYNILHPDEHSASITHLYEMLEGQVAILSSGLLSADESLELLRVLRGSALYQPGQHSYILYPDHNLPGFMEKNNLTEAQIGHISLIATLIAEGDQSLVTQDVDGKVHFSAHIRNIQDVSRVLEALKNQPRYAQHVVSDSTAIAELFEQTFHHNEFTGRSGTFFAYEGLGSVYWHMVSKLQLAAQETVLRFKDTPYCAPLVERYEDIRQGLGFNKTPAEYGAFPTDPYSHTPKGGGARQPGMTGMVKEAILARQAELGLILENGRLEFDNVLLNPGEYLTQPAVFSYLDVQGQEQQLKLQAGDLAYTVCQTPVVLKKVDKMGISVYYSDGTCKYESGAALNSENSQHIFLRDGFIHHLVVELPLGNW